MKRIIKALIACVAASTAMPVLAQAVDTDVVIMRRVVAKPNVDRDQNGNDQNQYHWETGPWTGGSTCSTASQQTRDVTCVRQRRQQADASCTQPRPADARTVENLSGCQYSWQITGHGEWSSTCSAAATRSTTSSCIRADGATVDDALCVGQRPGPETQEITTGCSYAWSAGPWSDYSSTCSATSTRDRTVTCRRSDGGLASAALCTGTRPEARETADVATSCTYSWRYGDWTVTPACGDSVRNRTATCIRSDDTSGGANCPVAEREPLQEAVYDTQTCSYAWKPGEWGEWNPTCSDNSSRSRGESCVRSDNRPVDNALCKDAAHNQLSESAGYYMGCAHEWSYGPWVSDSTCSKSTTQRRTATCMRTVNGGKIAVAPENCAGVTKNDVQTGIADSSSCPATWATGTWTPTPPASACTSNYAQTRTVTCAAKYPDNSTTTVADSRCTGAKPVSSQSIAVTTGCTYTPQYGNYGSCSGGKKTANISSCVRSDNVVVANSFCSPQSKTVSCFTCSLTQFRTTSFGSYGSTSSATLDSAIARCEQISNGSNEAGTCTWNSRTKGLEFGGKTANGQGPLSSGTAEQYAGYCNPTP